MLAHPFSFVDELRVLSPNPSEMQRLLRLEGRIGGAEVSEHDRRVRAHELQARHVWHGQPEAADMQAKEPRAGSIGSRPVGRGAPAHP